MFTVKQLRETLEKFPDEAQVNVIIRDNPNYEPPSPSRVSIQPSQIISLFILASEIQLTFDGHELPLDLPEKAKS